MKKEKRLDGPITVERFSYITHGAVDIIGPTFSSC
jgi:hypothetical protein